MKLLLLLIITITSSMVSAQDNPLPDFICMYTGEAILPYGFPKPANKQKIRTCTFLTTHVYKSENVERLDTSILYKIYYTPNGEQIGLEAPYSEFMGFSNIGYNKDGTLAFKEFETYGMRGCGNYHWAIGGKSRYDYEYKKGKCTKIKPGSLHFLQNQYNNSNQLILQEGYYRTSDSTDFEKLGYSFAYRYNKSHQLTDEFTLDFHNSNSYDSLSYLPGDIADRFYRQSPLFYDTILLRDYGVTEDSMRVEEDIPAALFAAINTRDSIDSEWGDAYQRLAVNLTSYTYNKQGQLIQRISFLGERIDFIETFSYNEKGQLTTWDKKQDYSLDWTQWDKGDEEIWQFEYNKNNQVVSCEQLNYTAQERNYDQRENNVKEPLKIEFVKSYSFFYDGERMTKATKSEKHWYYSSSNNPSIYEPQTYYMRYEHF